MSHIFDALQRSEAERSGVELDAFDVPTELLQIAESAVKTQTAVSEQPVTPSLETPATGSMEGSSAIANSEFEKFESLPVSLSPTGKLVTVTQKDSLAAEKFRFLAVRLRHMKQRRSLQKLLITSTVPEEGKSTVAANLSCALGVRKQQRILLIEGDLRRPTLQNQFGLGRIPGLADYLDATVNRPPVYRLEALGIWIIPAGKPLKNPLELIQSPRLSSLLEQMAGAFDWIIIDSPPVLPLADTSIWMRLSDGILLVTRQGTTDRDQLKSGLEAIEPSKLLGALVNSSSHATHSDYYQHYGAAVTPAA